MSVSNVVPFQVFSGNDVTTTFQIPCEFIAGSAGSVIKVYSIDSTGEMTLLTRGVSDDYIFDSDSAPVNVVMATAPATDSYLMIIRSSPLTQPTDYINTGKFAAESHERQMDRIVFLLQELDARVDRAFLMNVLQNASGEMLLGAPGEIPALNEDGDGLDWISSSEVANPSVQTSHAITAGQSATDLLNQTVDASVYTSLWYFYEIIRGTTIFSTGSFKLHYRNGAWLVVMGEDDRDDSSNDHGVTISTTGTTVAQLQAAVAADGFGDGTIKLRKFYFSV